jgi:hypothetical protein
MRLLRPLPLLGILVALAAVAAYFSASSFGLRERIASLANQPNVAGAFQHPETARSDALTTLIAGSVLTPIAAFFAVVVAVLLVKAFETVLVSVHLPGWLSAPVVTLITMTAMYETSEAWVPTSLYAVGIFARAYLVFLASGPP